MKRRLVVVHGDEANYCTDVRFLWPGMQTTDPRTCSHLVQFREQPIVEADTTTLGALDAVVIQRPVAAFWGNVIAYYTWLRSKYHFQLVLDFDDNLWDIYPECDKLLKYVATGIDFVTVTTKHLKDNIKKYGMKTIVVPNGVSDNLIHKVHSNPKTIFYGGAAGHKNDWNNAWKTAVNRLIDEGWTFYTVADKMDGIPGGKTVDFVHASNWGKLLTDISPSIVVAPLEDGKEINKGKSNLKYLEACAMEVPFLGTKLQGDGPYNGIGDLQLVTNQDSPEDIVAKIKVMEENPAPYIQRQNEYLDRKHLRMTDREFTKRWIESYVNGDQAQGW